MTGDPTSATASRSSRRCSASTSRASVRGGLIEIEERKLALADSTGSCDPGERELAQLPRAPRRRRVDADERRPAPHALSQPGAGAPRAAGGPGEREARRHRDPERDRAGGSFDVRGVRLRRRRQRPVGLGAPRRRRRAATRSKSARSGTSPRTARSCPATTTASSTRSPSDGHAYRCSMALDFQIATRYQFSGEVRGSQVMIYESSFEVLAPSACDNGTPAPRRLRGSGVARRDPSGLGRRRPGAPPPPPRRADAAVLVGTLGGSRAPAIRAGQPALARRDLALRATSALCRSRS